MERKSVTNGRICGYARFWLIYEKSLPVVPALDSY